MRLSDESILASFLSQLKNDVNESTQSVYNREVGLNGGSAVQSKKRGTHLRFSLSIPFYERKSGDFEGKSEMLPYLKVIND